ncbi:MAG: hypothetical protein R3C61_10115 [Bacteroidia bacterium]
MLRYYSRVSLFSGAILAFLAMTSCTGDKSAHAVQVLVKLTDDTWQYTPGASVEIPAEVTVAGKKSWKGPVTIRIRQGENVVSENTGTLSVPGESKDTIRIPVVIPDSTGTYEIVAAITQPDGSPFLSRKLIEVVKKIRKAEI